MSEYQYYEFSAVDRPLSPREQTELRRYSSRARITPGGFVNEYHWGDLKADPLALMQHYFDAHVYSANWGTCRLLLLGQPLAAERRLHGEFLAWQRKQHPMIPGSDRRTLAEIEAGVEAARSLRLEREREARAAEEAKRQAERARYLSTVAQQADRVWNEIDTLLQRRSGAAYDEALQRLRDLAEALQAAEREPEFRRNLQKLAAAYSRRPAWMKRLEKAGFLR